VINTRGYYWVPGNRVPEVGPWPFNDPLANQALYQANLRGGAADQVLCRATLWGRAANKLLIEQLDKAEVAIQYYWPTLATTRRVILGHVRTYVRHTKGALGDHYRDDYTPPRMVSDVSPLPCGASQTQSCKDLDTGVSKVALYQKRRENAPYRAYAYAHWWVTRGSWRWAKPRFARLHHETDPRDPPRTTTKTSALDFLQGPV
jgi:hypothetical protein